MSPFWEGFLLVANSKVAGIATGVVFVTCFCVFIAVVFFLCVLSINHLLIPKIKAKIEEKKNETH